MTVRLFVRETAVCLATAVVCAQGTPPSAGVAPQAVVATPQDTSTLRHWDAAVTAMSRDGSLALRKVRQDTLLAGRVHERYDQFVRGVRVFGGDVARQTSGGVTESIFGQLYDTSAVSTRPGLDEDDARAAFEGLAGDRGFPPDRPIELVILPTDDGRLVLTYRSHVWTDAGWMHTFIDARSGAVVLQYDDRQSQSAVGSGTGVLGDRKKVSARAFSGRFIADDMLRPPVLTTYDAGGDPRTADAWLSGDQPGMDDVASDSDNAWTDGASVDAHVYVGWTYDLLFSRFGRRSLDDGNVAIRAIVHPVRRADLETALDRDIDYYLNAFWCDTCGFDGRGMMVFGEGLPDGYVLTETGQSVDYFAAGLDVIAHELTHGMTTYSSNLVYRNESGALNESFSDIMGTAAEFFFEPPGSGLQKADYVIGEDVIRPGGFRSLANPGAFGHPDHYSKRFLEPEDNGGVHINSGISNHAFYLAIEGGVNRTSGLRVEGVGAANREQIEKVFYRAFVYLLPSSARFSTARAATIQAARDLYGAGSPAERAVTQAWTAVGVF